MFTNLTPKETINFFDGNFKLEVWGKVWVYSCIQIGKQIFSSTEVIVKICEKSLKFYELRTHAYLDKTFLILLQKVLKTQI